MPSSQSTLLKVIADVRVNSPLLGWEQGSEHSELPFQRKRHVIQQSPFDLPSLMYPTKRRRRKSIEDEKRTPRKTQKDNPKKKRKIKKFSTPQLKKRKAIKPPRRNTPNSRLYPNPTKTLKETLTKEYPSSCPAPLQDYVLEYPNCVQPATFVFPQRMQKSRSSSRNSQRDGENNASTAKLLMLDEKVRQMSRETDHNESVMRCISDPRSNLMKLVLCRFTKRARELSDVRSASRIIDRFFHNIPPTQNQVQKHFRRHSRRLMDSLDRYRHSTCDLVSVMKKFRNSHKATPLSHEGHVLVHAIMLDTRFVYKYPYIVAFLKLPFDTHNPLLLPAHLLGDNGRVPHCRLCSSLIDVSELCLLYHSRMLRNSLMSIKN